MTVAIGKVETDVDRLLEEVLRGEEVQRFARHLRREQSALFTFLYYDATPATNFLAQQALRPAVVDREMSAGDNTPRCEGASNPDDRSAQRAKACRRHHLLVVNALRKSRGGTATAVSR